MKECSSSVSQTPDLTDGHIRLFAGAMSRLGSLTIDGGPCGLHGRSPVTGHLRTLTRIQNPEMLRFTVNLNPSIRCPQILHYGPRIYWKRFIALESSSAVILIGMTLGGNVANAYTPNPHICNCTGSCCDRKHVPIKPYRGHTGSKSITTSPTAERGHFRGERVQTSRYRPCHSIFVPRFMYLSAGKRKTILPVTVSSIQHGLAPGPRAQPTTRKRG